MNERILSFPPDADPLLKRAMLFLESGDFGSAGVYCDKVLDADPENPFAYIIKLMAEMKLGSEDKLVSVRGLSGNQNFKFARRFASPELAAKLDRLTAENDHDAAVLAPLREAAAGRRQMLEQMIAGGLSEKQSSEVRERIAAEQAFASAPTEEAAAREAAATEALIANLNSCRKLREECVARQQTLCRLLADGLWPPWNSRLSERLVAEQALMLTPTGEAAAREAAATELLIVKIALARQVSKLQTLRRQNRTLPSDLAKELTDRIAAAEAMLKASSGDVQTLNNEARLCEAVLMNVIDRTGKTSPAFRYCLLGIALVVVIVIVYIIMITKW